MTMTAHKEQRIVTEEIYLTVNTICQYLGYDFHYHNICHIFNTIDIEMLRKY